MNLMNKFRTVSIIFAVCYFVTGAMMLFVPNIAGDIICYIIGGILALSGIFKVCSYFFSQSGVLKSKFGLVFGILGIIAGLFIIIRSRSVMEFLFFIIGAVMIISGIVKITVALDVRRSGYGKWWIELIFAVLVAAAGIVLVIVPSGGSFIMQIIGAALLANGIISFADVLYLYRAAKSVMTDGNVIETTFEENDRY